MPVHNMLYQEERISRMRVMVADPFNQLRDLIRDILLRGIGVGQVYDAQNGQDALKMVREVPCDVIIADAGMSPIGGIELTRRIREGEEGVDPFTPVIVMSGHASVGEILAARDAGANDFVAKPLSAKILDLRLRALVDRPRPFVRSDNFFGPDRRRHMHGSYHGRERRAREGDRS